MHNKKILLTAFILVLIVQLGVPAKMIWDREDKLKTGTTYKFRTAPVDPNDPFMGKYINLSYGDNSINIPQGQEWLAGEKIYVSISNDTNGFAEIRSISKTRPAGNHDFIKTKVGFIIEGNPPVLNIHYPFDRFYMEESKAYDAELAYIRSQQDSLKTTYALVNIKNGEAVLKDVMIDGISIRKLVKSNQEGKTD